MFGMIMAKFAPCVRFTGKATKDQKEALQLIEAGFEMLKISPDGTIYFRKWKWQC